MYYNRVIVEILHVTYRKIKFRECIQTSSRKFNLFFSLINIKKSLNLIGGKLYVRNFVGMSYAKA